MKPKVAIFDFGCCEGCQLQLVNLEERLLDLVGLVDVRQWREAMSEHADDYDIALVEGSITRESEIPRLQAIREQASILVAIGACAHTGGVNAMKNRAPMEEALKTVYGEHAGWFDTIPARPLSAVVTVDFAIPGCPIDRTELLEVLKALLMGKTPSLPTYPVCVQCKMAENSCVFDLGLTCMGPVSRAGCQAACPSNGNRCLGCRGLVPEPNVNAHKDVLAERGRTVEGILVEYQMFCSLAEADR
jgi:coenzyme F420-reducing hydrogenase gamma subunit